MICYTAIERPGEVLIPDADLHIHYLNGYHFLAALKLSSDRPILRPFLVQKILILSAMVYVIQRGTETRKELALYLYSFKTNVKPIS